MRVAPTDKIRWNTFDPHLPTPLAASLKRYRAQPLRFPPLVLVIDDSIDHLEMYEVALRDRYQVLQADRGEAGIEIAIVHRPDVVVVDLDMPGIDGWEVCRRLAADSRTASIPLVILTATDVENQRHVAMRIGVVDLLTKPCQVDLLRDRIAAALGRSNG